MQDGWLTKQENILCCVDNIETCFENSIAEYLEHYTALVEVCALCLISCLQI